MFFIQNCSKDPGPCGGQKTYYYLSEEDKAKVPYTGTDTLVFVSNTNDTAVCIGQGKKQFYTVEYDSGNPDCKPPEYYYEAYNYKFIDTNNLLNITLNVYNYEDNMEIKNNDLSLFPINLIYFYEKYYNDSASTNKNQYNTLRINNGKGFIVQYNLKKGIIKVESNNKTWRLFE
jgi:hypothetical protein